MKQTIRWMAGTGAVIMILSTAELLAQGLDFSPAGQENLVRYAITQGGLLIVLIIGAWMYRRDFVNIFNRQSETITVLSTALSASTAAISSTRAAVESLDRNVERLVTSTDGLRGTMVDAIRDRLPHTSTRERHS